MILLVVEDDPTEESMILRAVGRAGLDCAVDVAHDGHQALERLGLDGTTVAPSLPDLVLLDLKLPFVGGVDVLRRVREDARTRGLPVVVLSSSDDAADIAASYAAGANSYVLKPVDAAAFIDKVTSLTRYWAVVNQSPTRRP